ncbi:MAG TPA: glycosyltransferase [Thermoanaerobaculia bacterium]|nr:glycosyltransferase [Thermoanaerobaculia bacterium]
MSAPLASIILPVHNQADHIGAVVAEYVEALARTEQPYELILVPNGCRDESLAACRQLALQYPEVRVLTNSQSGWGHAVKIGLESARGELLGYTNSARTSAPDLILLLLYARVYPNIVVKANRKIRESWQRRLGSLLYNLQCRALFDLSNWDINGTPKFFPRSFTKLLSLTRTDDLIDAEFSVVARRENYPMLEVPIFSARRHGGRSTTNFRAALRLYWGAYSLRKALRRAAP